MKATGIVRRIDELGRIVIPIEIRKKLRINEGESIEIYIDESENIILKKYSNINSIKDFSQKLVESLYCFYKNNIIVTDTNIVVASSGSLKKDILGKEISNELFKFIKERKKINSYGNLELINSKSINCYYYINPIISNGDVLGLFIVCNENNKITKNDEDIFDVTTKILAKYLEE